MVEFVDQDLGGARFERVNLAGSRWHGVFLRGVTITDAWIEDVDISAAVRRLVVNGVDVTDYVQDELERGEFSFLQTLRHLVLAWDRWLSGPVFGEDLVFHGLGYPHGNPEDWRGVGGRVPAGGALRGVGPPPVREPRPRGAPGLAG